jgi:hypothetical protein
MFVEGTGGKSGAVTAVEGAMSGAPHARHWAAPAGLAVRQLGQFTEASMSSRYTC